MKDYSSEELVNELKEINWYAVTDIDDVRKAWSKFKT